MSGTIVLLLRFQNMANLKTLEFKYQKDFHTVFEDLATLMFCTVLCLPWGVCRRKNQKGIESDPVKIDKKVREGSEFCCSPGVYAYQAKYYSDKLNNHTNEIKESIQQARKEGVTHLLFFTNQWRPDRNSKTGKEPRFLHDIELYCQGTNQEPEIKLIWWDGSIIETSLDLPDFKNVRDIYFHESESSITSSFYKDVYSEFSETPKNSLYGDISLREGYIEPSILLDGSICSVKEFLEIFVNRETSIAVICGEPGHGKTSLCYKAMCDFYKKGWLCNTVSNVLCFSLNPATTSALANDSFNLYPLLSWGNDRTDKDHKFKESDCNNALIFFDGFDELLEWYPKYSIQTFIESRIVKFQKATGAHIIVTSRNMAIDIYKGNDSKAHGTNIPIYHLLPISKTQQIEWIEKYIKRSRNTSPEKAHLLEEYLESYKEMQDIEDIERILGIPSIFRMIVDAQYYPSTGKSLTQLYDDLFSLTWKRHEKKGDLIRSEMTTRNLLANHAIKVFMDNNVTARTSVSIKSSWLYSFYTTHDGDNRVGFLHRSFYQFFLAHGILSWYLTYSDKCDVITFIDELSQLSFRRVDIATLIHIKEICKFTRSPKALKSAFIKAYEILKTTDGILKLSNAACSNEKEKAPSPLERANNVFYNIISIGSVCGYPISNKDINTNSFKLYDLSKCILINADLHLTSLEGVKLSGANLAGADLSGADLSMSDLSGVVLSTAILTGAKLIHANFNKADLCEAKLIEANLKEANFNEADLTRADLSRTNVKNASFRNADLRNAILKHIDFGGVCFYKSNLSGGIDISWSNFSRTDFRRANLNGANLSNCNFQRADLSGANLSEVNLSHSDLSWANLSECDLSGANLEGANLCGANLSWANLSETSYVDNTSRVNNNGCNLSNAIIIGVNFTGANLSRAIFKQTNIENCIILNVKIDYSNAQALSNYGYDTSKMILIDR